MIRRVEIVQRWQGEGRAGRLVVGQTLACGSASRAAERAGLDLVVVDAGAKATLAGLPPLHALFCLNDANAVAVTLAEEILANVENTPVLAGLFGQVGSLQFQRLIKQVQQLGFSGVCNSPSLGCIDGTLRNRLEAEGIGFKKEVDLIAAASDAGLFTLAQVHDEREAEGMVAAGADALLLSPWNTIGLARWVGGLVETARAVDPTVQVLLKVSDAAVLKELRQMRGVAGVMCTGLMDADTLKDWKTEAAGSA
jgi:predicted TIM-barrel enzyme